jgi:SulP family sulfate permease
MAQFSSTLPKAPSLLAELARDLRPDRLLPSLTTGLVCGVLTVIVAFSFSALFFSGELSAFLPFGIGLIVLGDAVMCLTAALVSSHPSTIAIDQDGPAAILVTVTAGALVALPAALGAEQKFLTIVMFVVGTTLLTGLFFILMGVFKLGALVRFMPYPVAGGFLAGMGWPLIAGAVGLMTDAPLTLGLFDPALLWRWVPGILFTIALAVITARVSHPLTIPGLIVAAMILFYLVIWVTGTPMTALADQGWLFKFESGGGQWRFPFAPSVLAQVQWPVLLANLPKLAPVLVIGVVILLLNVTGTELIVKQDIDLNRELIAAGVSNLTGGLAGAMVGFHAISLAGLNHKLSGSSRITGLVTAAFCVFCALLGPLLLAFVPKLVLGGLLAFLGVSFIMEWIVDARKRFPRLEYAIILVIAVVSAAVGFLEGMGVGLVAAVLLFVINYSRINVVKHSLTGLTYRSRVTRGSRQRKLLQEHGEQTYILQLQGYLFFGTANSLLEQVRDRVSRTDLPPVRFLILDFHHVPGLDSTAILSFSKMKQLAQERGLTLVLTGLTGEAQKSFARSDFLDPSGLVHVLPDLDRGMEWCEAKILADAGVAEDEAPLSIQLAEVLARPEQLQQLLKYLERKDAEPDAYLIRQGDEPDVVYFIERGQVTAQLEPAGQAPIRLETMRGGRVVGEIGFYLGAKRTAAVRADEPTTVYHLSQAKLQEMEQTDPETANTFHRLIIHLLSERVTHLIRAVDALLR